VREPDRPQLLGQWVRGAAGAHRNFYNGGQWVHATSSLPGFEGQVLAIVDIADPASPKTAGTWWHPGQTLAEPAAGVALDADVPSGSFRGQLPPALAARLAGRQPILAFVTAGEMNPMGPAAPLGTEQRHDARRLASG
jgi:hypothetical protein